MVAQRIQRESEELAADQAEKVKEAQRYYSVYIVMLDSVTKKDATRENWLAAA